jgi:hypothetical protein
VNGGFAPAVRIEQRETHRGDGTIRFQQIHPLSDGTGHWQLSEVREGISEQENGPTRSKDERVFRIDGNGNLSLVERTVSKQTEIGSGEKRDMNRSKPVDYLAAPNLSVCMLNRPTPSTTDASKATANLIPSF